MFSHTKKVGSAGRYGERIGKKVRDALKKIEHTSRKDRNCPFCGKTNVKRKSAGVWKCGPCDSVFTGGGHSPKTKKKLKITKEGR